jgi:hypothetical protein
LVKIFKNCWCVGLSLRSTLPSMSWSIFKRFLLSAAIGYSAVPCAQQYVDLARIYALSTPEIPFDSSAASTRLYEYNADVTLPITVSDRVVFMTGTTAEGFRARLDDSSQESASAKGLLVKLGCSVQHSERFRMTYLFLPRYSGDGGKWQRNDMQWGGLAMGKWKKSDSWTWQFGAMYNSELFGPFVVPLLGFYAHKPQSRWEANFMLPASADVNFAVSPKFRVGSSFVSAVRSYFLNDIQYTSTDAYWVKSTNELYGYVQWEPAKGLILQGRVGFSVARRFSLYELGDQVDWALMAIKFGDDRTRLNTLFADSPILQLRLIYRYYTE